jgi:hypothetical protein
MKSIVEFDQLTAKFPNIISKVSLLFFSPRLPILFQDQLHFGLLCFI